MTTILIGEVDLVVKVIGRGYPLVPMHSGPGADRISMLAFKPCADQFTLIFYDHCCNGRLEGAAVPSINFDNLTADAEALANGIPDTNLEIIERAGHNAPTERPADVIEVIRRFFEDNPPRLESVTGPSGGTIESINERIGKCLNPSPTRMRSMPAS